MYVQMNRFTSIILLLISTKYGSSFKLENLNGQWLLRAESEAEDYKDLNATVPGGIYTDLMSNNIINDIFYGYGDIEYRWIPKLNWTYYTEFTVDEELFNHEYINIVFEGLDTFAIVVINDIEVGISTNMFTRYVFDIKEPIQLGKNAIEVQFLSPIEVANKIAQKQSEDYIVPPDCPDIVYRGECHVNQIRKMQASFAWDWGPAFPSVGIWKDVYVEAFNTSVIRYILVNTIESTDQESWVLIVTTYFHNTTLVQGKLDFILHIDDNKTINASADVNQSPNEYYEILLTYAISVPSDSVQKWWPNGYGNQSLYNLQVTFTSGEEQYEKSTKIGFRKVELIQDEIDSGLTFYFKINDVTIFAKGANLIPVDILPEKGQNKTTIQSLLISAKEANMNMLRIWGGGTYESDYLYELADEFGILIWQDFMFACGMFPTRPEFLSTVTEEVRHQIKRLISHPSIILWSGNNENEGALVDNWYGTVSNYDLYKADYIKLYIDTIKSEVNRIASYALFIGSSPTNGKQSEIEGYVANHPGDVFYGDIHFYNYQNDSFSVSNFLIPRFSSEYGYQSMPDIDSWLTTTNNISNLHPEYNFIDHRQHHPGGTQENTDLIEYQLNLPDKMSENYYKAFIFYSQVVQAMSVKIETEHYRSFMGRYNEEGKGNTMGALYWQLNDVWVAPTWSGIDYTGKWKLLHYFAKEFFSPILITGRLKENQQLGLYVVSDNAAVNGTAVAHVYRWDNFSHADNGPFKFPISLEPATSLEVAVIDIPTALSDAGCGDNYEEAINNCFFNFHLMAYMDYRSMLLAPTNNLFLGKFKNANVKQANLMISDVIQSDSDGEVFEIAVTTDVITLFVTLNSHQIRGKFSENGYIQMKETIKITFTAEEATTASELKNVLTVTHLFDPEYL